MEGVIWKKFTCPVSARTVLYNCYTPVEDFFFFSLTEKGKKLDIKEWKGELKSYAILWPSYL